MPLNTDIPTAAQRLMVDACEEMLESRRKIVERTNNYGAGKYLMPVQMLFHRARLRGFEVVPVKEMQRRLKQAQSEQ
jgi:hypothetical protein